MISASALARQSLIIWPLRPELGEQDMHATQVTPDVTPAELVKRAEQMVPTLRARAAHPPAALGHEEEREQRGGEEKKQQPPPLVV